MADDRRKTKAIEDHGCFQSLSAEKSVLGCALLDSSAADVMIGILKRADFYNDLHGGLFGVIEEERRAGREVDVVIATEKIMETGWAKELPEHPALFVREILETVPYAVHVAHYAEIVRDRSLRRKAWNGYLQAQQKLKSFEPVSEIVGETMSDLQQVMSDSVDDHPESAKDLLIGVVTKSDAEMIQTYYRSLDAITGGMAECSMTVMAARPSIGKTALAIGIIRREAQHHHPVLFFSKEMPKLDVMQRLASITTGLPFSAIRDHQLNQIECEQLMEMQESEWLSRIYIDDEPGRTITELSAIIRLYVQQKGVKVVVIDYLQLIRSENTKQQREQQVAEISRALKGIAKKNKIRILCLSQLNREVDKRDSKKPRLSDLRESGAIEQDADQVWLLWRPNKDPIDHRDEDNIGEVIVAKSRNGQTGVAKLAWHGPTMTYSDWESKDGF